MRSGYCYYYNIGVYKKKTLTCLDNVADILYDINSIKSARYLKQ